MPFLRACGKAITFNTGFANASTDVEKTVELVEKDNSPLHHVSTKLEAWQNVIDVFLTKA